VTSALLEPIRQALLAGDLELAQQALIDSLYSSEAISYWHTVTRLPSAESVHHALSFVSGFRFDPKEKTACIDPTTRVLTMGVDFFLDTFLDYGDLLFLLFHERGHLLIALVYGSQMPAFKDRKFANLWEDVFINNTILFLMNCTLCSRTYSDSHPFWRSLLCQEFTKWVAENHEWLRFHLTPLQMRLVRDTALGLDFFTQRITYSEWMDMGLRIEKGLRGDPERQAMLGTIGSGDLLGDLIGEEELVETAVREEVEGVLEGGSRDITTSAGTGVTRIDSDGCQISGVEVNMPKELPAALKQVLHSFAPNECPPEFESLLNEMNLKMEIEKTILEALVGDVLSRKQGEPVYEGRSASFERLHRRDMFWLAAGYDQTIWTIDLPVAKKALKLYMDVSGSMWTFLEVMMLIHRHLAEWVDEHFHFSTSIVLVDPTQNLIFSTGGTSYQAVAEHILQEGHEEVIVLTDNTDSISSAARAQLKRQLKLLYLIQTREGGTKNGFQELATKTITLPKL